MKDVFEGTSVTLTLYLTKGKTTESKKAKLVFETTGSTKLSDVELELGSKPFVGKSTPVKRTVRFPTVPDSEENYEVGYHVVWNGQRVAGGERWRVWPETVKLTTKRKIDGSLTPNGLIPVSLVQGDVAKDSMMPSTGDTMLLVSEPGPFEIKLPSPTRFVQWLDGKDKGRERRLEFDIVPHVARIVTPPGDAKTAVPQFVNIGFRNEVKFEVTTQTHDGDPAPNQDVYVEINFTNNTKRGTRPPPGADADYLRERSAARLGGVQKSNDNKTWKGKLKTGPDAKADFAVHLGKGGGEICEVKVGSTDTAEDDARKFETWRKLFIQHTHSGTGKTAAAWPMNKRQATIDAYKAVFIELEFLAGPDGGDVVYPPDLKLGERCGWVDGAEIDGTAGEQCFVVNTAGESWTRIADKLQPADAAKRGLFINIAAVDLMFEVKNGTISKTADRNGVVTLKGKDCSKSNDDSFGSLPNKPIYKTRARYKLLKVENYKSKPVPGGEGDVPEENISYSTSPKDDRGTLTIKLPKTAIDQIKADANVSASVTIDYMMKVKGSGAVGVSDGAHSVILSHGACGDAEANNTVIHEIGHCIGMCADLSQLGNKGIATVVNRLPDYTIHQFPKSDGTMVADWSYKEHSRWYNERGHQGNHCATGLGESVYKDWGKLSGVKLRNLGTFKCVIYGQSQIMKTPVQYCDECAGLLKAMELWVGLMPKAPSA